MVVGIHGGVQGIVLVVDDQEPNRQLLKDMLETGGHTVLTAADGRSAIETAALRQPGVILLDVKMPGMDGFEVCRRLKAMAETRSIPVIFVTANYTEEDDMLHGLEIGGYDYLVKPVSRQMLLARVGVMLRIRATEERIRQMSMVDEFTGLFSRTYVLRRLDEEMERAQRRRSSLVVAMIDIDDFKHVNDTYGHQAGDEVLRRVSFCLKNNIRLYDSIGRYGGEEFLLLQPELHESEAAASIERLREKVFADRLSVNGSDFRIGFSAGVCAWDYHVTLEELIRRADTALLAAKQAGKNRIVRYAETVSGRVSVPLSTHS